jgi:hypothetical protein
LAVYPLDPTDEQSVVHLGRTVIGFGKINLLVLASGQAILDSACSSEEEYYHENMAANYVTKVAAFRALQSAGCLASDAQVLVVSSRVLDFVKNAPEVSGQQGYRTSIAALEGWVHNEAKSQGCQSMFHICRMPLIVSPTADVYIQEGVVSADYPLVDPLQYAAAEDFRGAKALILCARRVCYCLRGEVESCVANDPTCIRYRECASGVFFVTMSSYGITKICAGDWWVGRGWFCNC